MAIDATGSAAAALLLRRTAVLHLDDFSALLGGPEPSETAEVGVVALEAELLRLGYLVAAPLREALAGFEPHRLAAVGRWATGELADALGAKHDHVPLFRGFPDTVPASTLDFFVQRVFSLLLQDPEQPCVLCGTPDTVHAVSPCAHLVCRACWDGSDFSACPICHRRIDPEDPFLKPEPPSRKRRARTVPAAETAPPSPRARLLTLGSGLDDAVRGHLNGLLARSLPPTPAQLADIAVLQAHLGHRDLGWLPDAIPAKLARAAVIGTLIADPAAADRVPEVLAAHAGTATDVLRILFVALGGSADLETTPPGPASPDHRPLPRRTRRSVLGLLDTLRFESLADDLHRNTLRWKILARSLHPFEQAERHPRAALAFALLRGTAIDADSRLGRLLLTTAEGYPESVARTPEGRLAYRSWGRRVEQALEARDLNSALYVLAERPGELLRRTADLVHRASLAESVEALVHAVGAGAGTVVGADTDTGAGSSPLETSPSPGEFATVLAGAVGRVSPGVLLSTLGALRSRLSPGQFRVFFPGGGATGWLAPERRAALRPESVSPLISVIEAELDRRAALLPAVERALVDEALDDVIAPFAQTTASRALVELPRGSAVPLPGAGLTRLFLHWMEKPGQRVDLDLSVSCYDQAWQYLGKCDYTQLRFEGGAAVHSGDLTSAPAPLGATEFVDLDTPALLESGARYLLVIVFSFNNIAFEDLAEGFAGLMRAPAADGGHFDPRAVEQRFDLHGSSRAALPLFIDLRTGRMRWLDVNASVKGATHSLHDHEGALAGLTEAMEHVFSSGARVNLWELAIRHAAGRTDRVDVRGRDGGTRHYRREADEDRAAFARRLLRHPVTASQTPDSVGPEQAGPGNTAFDDAPTEARAGQRQSEGGGLFLLHNARDVVVPKGGDLYSLYPAAFDTSGLTVLGAADLVSSLAAEPAAAAKRVGPGRSDE